MKITRAQKEAVISLLKEKFDEREKEVLKVFIAKNNSKIQKEFNTLITAKEKLTTIEEQYLSIKKEYETIRTELAKNNKKLSYYQYDASRIGSYTKEKFINLLAESKFEAPVRPNFDKVERQLELDSLDKDFDLNAFIEKYLGE